MIRDLQKVQDFDEVVRLATSFYQEQETKFTLDTDGMRLLLQQAMIPELSIYFCKLLEHEETVQGFIFGVLGRPAYFKEVIAAELAWYVAPAARGGPSSVKLLRAFEDWAKYRGADYVALSHLGDPMIDNLYQRYGYALKEHVYVKGM